jgi:hypothetical protein
MTRDRLFLGPQPRRPLSLIHREAQEVENLLDLIWLLDDRERSGSASSVPGRGIDPAADDDDRQHVSATSHGFEKLDTAHSRQVHIKDQAVTLGVAIGIEKLPARCELPRLQALAFEEQPERIPYSSIIVEDENHRSFPARTLTDFGQAALIRLDLDQLGRPNGHSTSERRPSSVLGRDAGK